MSEPTPIPHKTGVDIHHWAAAHPKIIDLDKAIVETTRKKVALVGFAMSSTLEAPFEDPEFEIFAMNQLYRHIPRADRWFDIHENWNEHVVAGTDHAKWLQEFPGPIYMAARVPGIPTSVPVPIDELIAIGADYFTSSIAYMIAIALRDGFTTIHLYGIDLVVNEEWGYQKPCAEYWLGLAQGKGVDIGVHRNSALLKGAYRYGLEREPKSLILMSELVQRIEDLRKKRNTHMIELANLDGALQDAEMFHELGCLRARGAQVAYTTNPGLK